MPDEPQSTLGASDIVAILRPLISQAKKGNAGLIAISTATAERIVKLLESGPVHKRISLSTDASAAVWGTRAKL